MAFPPIYLPILYGHNLSHCTLFNRAEHFAGLQVKNLKQAILKMAFTLIHPSIHPAMTIVFDIFRSYNGFSSHPPPPPFLQQSQFLKWCFHSSIAPWGIFVCGQGSGFPCVVPWVSILHLVGLGCKYRQCLVALVATILPNRGHSNWLALGWSTGP